MHLLAPRRPGPPASDAALSFVVLVPAHDEEEHLARTVKSLLAVDYPPALRRVVVVADNCSDRTAEVAREAGAECLVRDDPSRRGKGYALQYALERVLPDSPDAVVVVDADSIAGANFLARIRDRMAAGSPVVQACYGIENPDASPLTYLFAVGSVLENRFFYEAKARLGLPVALRGNGMAFRAGVLAAHPWGAHSIVEDTEYTVTLIRAGVRIDYAPEAFVLARQPVSLAQGYGQRLRWASGTSKLSRLWALRLIAEGLRRGRAALCDLGFALLVGSKPLLLLGNLALLLVSAVLLAAAPSAPRFPLLWSIGLLAVQAAYLGAGVLAWGLGGRRGRYLAAAPFYAGWLSAVSLLGLFQLRGDIWQRTRRS